MDSTAGFIIWDRKLRQPVGQPFLTREAARAVINRDFGGDLRLHVRRVEAVQR